MMAMSLSRISVTFWLACYLSQGSNPARKIASSLHGHIELLQTRILFIVLTYEGFLDYVEGGIVRLEIWREFDLLSI